MTEIFECTKKDLPSLSVLWEKMIYEVMPISNPNKELWIKHIEAYMEHHDFKAYKAIVNNEPIGYIAGMLFADPAMSRIVAIGLEFYVLPEYRGAIGARLYLKLAKLGKARGAKEMRLICYKKSLSQWEQNNLDVMSYFVRKEL